MSTRFGPELDRRQFLERAALGALLVRGFGVGLNAETVVDEDPPNTHNMLVVGERRVFLSHLPMFDGPDESGARFMSPHRFQVIVEAAFSKAGKDVSDLYAKDRQANPRTPIYTLNPEDFVLSRLFTPQNHPRLTTFSARVFRGHLEHGGKLIPGLEKTQVKVNRVVHARMFNPRESKPDELEYILFGAPGELYLAHTIVGPPDFNQVLSVKLTGRELSDSELGKDVRIGFPDRKNVPAERLRQTQQSSATLRIGPAETSARVQVEAGAEVYFEQGELLVPPTFDQTAEEKKQ